MAGTIERIDVTARLQDPTQALQRAASAARDGDRSWQEWISDHAEGRAFVVALEVRLTCCDGCGERRVLERRNDGVWLERCDHLPELEAQLQEVAIKDFDSLTRELHDLGIEVMPERLAQMAMHAQVGEELQTRLARDARGSAPPAWPARRPAL